jgi:hypothetical protein
MTRKLSLSLAPMLAAAALALAPATAQANPPVHWQENDKAIATGVKAPTISWGTLELASTAQTTKCRTASTANVENASTQANEEVVMFASYECKGTGGECVGGGGTPALSAAPGVGPAWRATANEEGTELEGTFRQSYEGVVLNASCTFENLVAENLTFQTGELEGGSTAGTFTPAFSNGSTATKPSEVSFDSLSGSLVAGSGTTEEDKPCNPISGTPTGKLKTVGYKDNGPTPLITLGRQNTPAPLRGVAARDLTAGAPPAPLVCPEVEVEVQEAPPGGPKAVSFGDKRLVRVKNNLAEPIYIVEKAGKPELKIIPNETNLRVIPNPGPGKCEFYTAAKASSLASGRKCWALLEYFVKGALGMPPYHFVVEWEGETAKVKKTSQDMLVAKN